MFLLFSANPGLSFELLSILFDCSISTVCRYLCLMGKVVRHGLGGLVYWPDAERRAELAELGFTNSKGVLLGAIGAVDGTHFDIYRPTSNQELYFSGHLRRHCLSARAVVGMDRKILFLSVGFPGSFSDSNCFKRSGLYLTPERFFSDGEYLLGDSAYKRTEYLKTVSRFDGHREEQRQIKRCRVLVENVFGAWKNKWRHLSIRMFKSNTDAANFIVSLGCLYNLGVDLYGV